MAFLLANGRQQYFDDSGNPLNGGRLFTMQPGAGITTPKATWTDAGETALNTNPIILNARGEAQVFWSGDYNVRLETSAGGLIWTVENINGLSFLSNPSVVKRSDQVAAPAQTAFTLPVYTTGIDGVTITVDGLMLPTTDYTETNNTTITFAVPFLGGEKIIFLTTWLIVSSTGIYGGVTLEQFGGSADGVTDNLGPFNSAVANGANVIYAMSPGTYYFSAGITIPPGVLVQGAELCPGNPSSGGVSFTFALATAVCVTLGGAASLNGQSGINKVLITRKPGVVPAGSIGLLSQNNYAVSIEDVASFRHAIGLELRGDRHTRGIATMICRFWSGAITDSHVVIDSVPESRFDLCRFGSNGAADVACNSFVRIKGGSTSNAACGPNSGIFTSCQFNQGTNTAAAWLEFKDRLVGSINDASLWQVDTCYIETSGCGIKSDASWTLIQRCQVSNTTFNMTAGVPFLSLNAATQIDAWQISNTLIYGAFALAPTPQINFLHLDSVQILGNTSLTSAAASSSATISNCTIVGSLTLAGTWASLQVFGGAITSGVLNNTATSATGGISINTYPLNSLIPVVPVLKFGGSAVGITYFTQASAYQIIGNRVYAYLHIILTAKGVAAGVATITIAGLPAPMTSAPYSIANSGNVAYTVDLAGLVGPVSGSVGLGPVINMYNSSATGVAALTNANFTNTSEIAIEVSYLFLQ